MIQGSSGSEPAFICDNCNKPIRSLGMGMAFFSHPEDYGGPCPLVYIHKGDCDKEWTAEKEGRRILPWSQISDLLNTIQRFHPEVVR